MSASTQLARFCPSSSSGSDPALHPLPTGEGWGEGSSFLESHHHRTSKGFLTACAAALCIVLLLCTLPAGAEPWTRHTIDASSQGADGVRLADVNGDGLPDIVTPWEEGGVIRVCVNPGAAAAHETWPSVTVGRVPTPEDAVLVDLDGDGAMDVVSSCEGTNRAVYVHWAPRDAESYMDASAWTTEVLPASQGVAMWMMCVPIQLDGEHGVDLVCAAKGKGALVGWFQCPENPRDLDAWTWHRMCDAGWVMSVEVEDMDRDGDPDFVFSDRKGPSRGCRWIENPGVGPAQTQPWTAHAIGTTDREVMFLAMADLTSDSLRDIVVNVKDDDFAVIVRYVGDWWTREIAHQENAGSGKGVAVADLDLDGRVDLAMTCEHAEGKRGVFWLADVAGAADPPVYHDVGGLEGVKFDLVCPVDLDDDGDLDLITCEERDNLGVVWYENPVVSGR
ncbi:MAG: VCBS repeat-containing protein [bacterium]|nr:VCBS repeat-containing protein [bacterium]